MRLVDENDQMDKKFKFCVSLWYFVSGCEMSCYQPIFPGANNTLVLDIHSIGQAGV